MEKAVTSGHSPGDCSLAPPCGMRPRPGEGRRQHELGPPLLRDSPSQVSWGKEIARYWPTPSLGTTSLVNPGREEESK